jgi:hypothetical protein
MVTVPNVCAFSPPLMSNPAIVYVSDTFQKPYPFTPDVVVAIDGVVEQKVEMLHAHTSQLYEWLPANGGYLDHVPAEADARRLWLRQQLEPRLRHDADHYRAHLIAHYGAEIGQNIQYAEAFEVCEYGAPLTPQMLTRLFPFFPSP